MQKERRKTKRYPCTDKVGIFLARGEHGSRESATLTGHLFEISSQGAGLSLPQILDSRTHLAYTAMESKDIILHVILYHNPEQEIIIPATPIWFNRSLSEHLTPFKLGVEFIETLTNEQMRYFAK